MDRIFLGMKGHVVCLNRKDGSEVWRTKLKSSQLTNVVLEQSNLYVAAGGHLYCLQATDGKLLWENQLSGLGYGPCIIATENQSAPLTANLQAQQAASVATTAAITTSTQAS